MKLEGRALAILTTAFVLIAVSSTMMGQAVNAKLLGTVADSSGAVVLDAKVKVTETSTGLVRTTVTNSSGNYEFVDLPPGQYEVTVEEHGFKKAVRTAIDLQVNSDVRVNVTLQPGAADQSIEVVAQAPILETDRADVTQKIETKQVTDLPLGTNRNFQNLLNLVPGTTRAHREHSTFFNAQDSLSTEVNGQSRLFNNLLIEGVDDNERTGLLQIYVPPAEAIQTVDVTTSDYLAEFGRVGGAVTNVALKSGTNNFHGSAYEFNRVSALAARDFFNRPPGPFPRSTYNYYGGTIGGPIIKNKLFFFGDILRVSDLRGRFNLFTVPTDAFRNGDFRDIKSLASCQGKATDCNIYDPATGSATGTGRTQFSFNGQPNVIDPARFSPIAQKLLALVPHANLPGFTNNFQNTTRFLRNTTSFDTKLDYNRTENDRLAFRFSRAVQSNDEQPVFGLAGGPGQNGFQGTGNQTVHSAALIHTHLFSPTLVAETRIGLSHYHNVALNADSGSNASNAIGIPGVNLNGFTSGLTSIIINGINGNNPLVGYSASMPWDRGETNISVASTWTKTHGNHSFKWGADIRRLRDDLVQAQTFGPRGAFTFGTGTTALNAGGASPKTSLANNFAALLLDAPTTVGRDVSVISGSWRETEVFTFFQDQWQLSRKLTLTGGVRWELYLPPNPSRAGGYSNYNPANNTLVVAGIGGNPDNLGRETYYHYFAPRLGVAYRLTENTVVRAGFGISYEPFPNNNYAFNFPVRQANGFPQPNSFKPATTTLALGFPPPATAAVPANGIVTPAAGDTYFVINQKFQQPYVEAWNLAVERLLPYNMVATVAYVGNHGTRIPQQYDLNAATAPGVDSSGHLLPNVCAVEPLCQQFGRTASTNFLYLGTSSNYDALQTRLSRKWAKGFLMTASYTFGKALAYRSDGGSDGGNVFNYLDFRRNYSVASYNRTHTFVTSSVYELPFGKGKPFLQSGWANWIAGGWQISSVLTLMSGRPLDFSANGNSL
ncbi:MAG TPA: TonB-dependent receptor, partial [Candidatus Angelobacter sp.]|nr:TonB-dependent receptor [Candidatus Angelobacter sp.]